MMPKDDPKTWQWQPSDQGFHFEILPRQRVPLPPSIVLQGRYALWRIDVDPNWVPNLRGKSLDEVEWEATQI